jgi:regulator of protease activity HflC (stomatin/prohibitin superfamily)
LQDGNVQALNYFVAQRYVDALGKIGSAENQKLVLLPLEATSILGSLSGIAEIAKSTFANKE